MPFETVLIDNTGGRKPRWWAGNTPQVLWPDGKRQGESLDLLRELDRRYPTRPLWEPPGGASRADVAALVSSFARCFPSGARPSSRAAFLFGYDGAPLPRSDFEAALDATEALLGEHGGPFFAGAALSAADVSWAPFLERYGAQLPCLHEGLCPRSTAARWPRLAAWYGAMDGEPAYACRLKGDGASWKRVLEVQGYGNLGSPPALVGGAGVGGAAPSADGVWRAFADGRPHVAPSAAEELAARVTRNRAQIAADARPSVGDDGAVDAGLRALVALLLAPPDEPPADELAELAAPLAEYLEARVCVPRDVGEPPAAVLRALARRLGVIQ